MINPTPSGGSRPGPTAGGQITPELVREIADRVYDMLLRELRLEREQRRDAAPFRQLPDANR